MANSDHPTCFKISDQYALGCGETGRTPCRTELLLCNWQSVDNKTSARRLDYLRISCAICPFCASRAPTSVNRKIHNVDSKDSQRDRARLRLYPLVSRKTQPKIVRSPTVSGSLTNIRTISPVHPNTNRQTATIRAPPIMKGLRLPHFDLELSASTPTTGCMISPDKGPAIHTSDVRLLVRPSWRR